MIKNKEEIIRNLENKNKEIKTEFNNLNNKIKDNEISLEKKEEIIQNLVNENNEIKKKIN